MQLWMILLLIAVALWLISLVRFGASVDYDGAGLAVMILAGPVRIPVYPPKKKDKPPKHAAPETQPEARKQPVARGGNLELVKKFLPLAAQTAGRVKRKIRIDYVDLHVIWGAADPALCAMGYGYANAALGMLWPLIENNFNVRRRQLRTSVDYGAASPSVMIRAALSLTVGQGLVLGAVVGVKWLRLFLQYRKEQKLKEAV